MRAAVAEELAEGHGDVGPRELKHMSKVSIPVQLQLNDSIQALNFCSGQVIVGNKASQ